MLPGDPTGDLSLLKKCPQEALEMSWDIHQGCWVLFRALARPLVSIALCGERSESLTHDAEYLPTYSYMHVVEHSIKNLACSTR